MEAPGPTVAPDRPLKVPGPRMTCAFCLRSVARDSGSAPPPGTPPGILETDAPMPLVCPPCSQLFHRVFGRTKTDSACLREAEGPGTPHEREIKRRYPGVPFTNHNIDYSKRLHFLLMAKLFARQRGTRGSVVSFSLRNIPYTAERAFSFGMDLLHFGIRQPPENHRMQNSHYPMLVDNSRVTFMPRATHQPIQPDVYTEKHHGHENDKTSVGIDEQQISRPPWPTAYYLKNPGPDLDADPQARKRSRLSWCDPKDPCLYCRDHIEAMLSGRTRGSRRKSCQDTPEKWKHMDDRARWETRESALARAHGIQPAFLALGSLEHHVPAFRLLPPQDEPSQTPQNSEHQPNQPSAKSSPSEPEKQISIPSYDSHESIEPHDEILSLGKESSDSPASPKRRRLRRNSEKASTKTAEETNKQTEHTSVPNVDEESLTEDAEKEAQGETKLSDKTEDQKSDNNEEPVESHSKKRVKKRRKRLRGLSKELRSLQLWSHWPGYDTEKEESEEDTDSSTSEEETTPRAHKTDRRRKPGDKAKSDGDEIELRRSKRPRKSKSFDSGSESEKEKEKRKKSEDTTGQDDRVPEKKAKKVQEEATDKNAGAQLQKEQKEMKDRQKEKIIRKAKRRKDRASMASGTEEKEQRKRWQQDKELSPPPKKDTNQTGNPPKDLNTAVEALMSMSVDSASGEQSASPRSDSESPKKDEERRIDLAMESRTKQDKLPHPEKPLHFEEIEIHDDDDDDEDSSSAKSLQEPPSGSRPASLKPLRPAVGKTPPPLPGIANLLSGGSSVDRNVRISRSAPATPSPPQSSHRAARTARQPEQPSPPSPYALLSQGSYPYMSGRPMTTEAYAAHLAAAAHLSPIYTQFLQQSLQQSLLYPTAAAAIGGPAAASHATQTLFYTPLLNLPSWPSMTSHASDPRSTPGATTPAATRTNQPLSRFFSLPPSNPH